MWVLTYTYCSLLYFKGRERGKKKEILKTSAFFNLEATPAEGGAGEGGDALAPGRSLFAVGLQVGGLSSFSLAQNGLPNPGPRSRKPNSGLSSLISSLEDHKPPRVCVSRTSDGRGNSTEVGARLQGASAGLCSSAPLLASIATADNLLSSLYALVFSSGTWEGIRT